MLLWILGFGTIASLGAAGGASVMLLAPERIRRSLVPWLVSYATGTLLGAALLGMLPTSLARADPAAVMKTVLAGIVLFFVLEKAVLWRHCHDADCPTEHRRAAPLILVGDTFHNFVDGIVVAAAFRTSIPIGIATAFAVVAHEIPQELGDFAILLDAGWSPRKALFWNALAASATLPGALLGWYALGPLQEAVPYILAMAAASFIYIATADLIPELHRRVDPASSLRQLALMLAGVGTIELLRAIHH